MKETSPCHDCTGVEPDCETIVAAMQQRRMFPDSSLKARVIPSGLSFGVKLNVIGQDSPPPDTLFTRLRLAKSQKSLAQH